jgi:hypothetical protein
MLSQNWKKEIKKRNSKKQMAVTNNRTFQIQKKTFHPGG